MAAAQNGRIEVIDFLLDHDPEVTYEGDTAFTAACKNRQLRFG